MEAQEQNKQLHYERETEDCILYLSGIWAFGKNIISEELLFEDLEGCKTLRFDCAKLEQWDSSLVVLLFKLHEFCIEKGIEFQSDGLNERLSRILHLATEVPEKRDAKEPIRHMCLFDRIGHHTLSVWTEVKDILFFTGQLVIAMGKLIRGKASFRIRDFLLIVEDTGIHSLPIILLISFLVGIIIAFLGAVVLSRFGAEFAVSYIVGYGMLREMGAIMTGVIMAGRTGAAFAAQLGTMKVSEEIDALRTMGISVVEFLVLPRMIALLLMLPLLTVFADIVGIFGGYVVAKGLMDLPSGQFFYNMNFVAGISDCLLGIFKGAVFGTLIAFSGCLRGMQCGNSADSVGLAATRAVVTGITLIIIANALIDWAATVFNV